MYLVVSMFIDLVTAVARTHSQINSVSQSTKCCKPASSFSSRFDNETCKGGNSIQVKLEDRLHVVCPNKATVLKAIDELPSTDELYENVYITDKRRAFLNCDANSAGVKHVKSCNQPGKKEFNYLLVRFTSFGTAPMWLFKPGETYYFFGECHYYSHSF